MRWVALFALLMAALGATAQELKVGITPQQPYLDIQHDGKTVRIQRIQDTNHRLIDSWSKTSRPCPPACIQPMQIAPEVQTLGELEVIDFLDRRARNGEGLLLDNRLPEFYRLETIPAAVNMPVVVLQRDNPHLGKVLEALGVRRLGTGWDFKPAKEIVLFCAAVWCDDSPKAARLLLSLGYPAERVKYYRGGLQAWRSVGLTTVVPGR